MSEHIIKNDIISATVSDHGAELRSLVILKSNKEVMWQADPKFWGRTSPVLFPIVGGLWGNKYSFKGETYSLPKHGFARDMDFELVSETKDELVFELQDNEETRKVYPFSFTLRIGYKLTGAKLEVKYEVFNNNTDSFYFSIGAHPAFVCNLNTDKLLFEKDGKPAANVLKSGVIDMSNGCLSEKVIDVETCDGVLELKPELFDNDALIFDDRQSNSVTILRAAEDYKVKVSFDAPLFGVWSPDKKNAPFVCIEPWNGRCDRVGFTGSLEDREHGNVLSVGESFSSSFFIEIK